MSLSMQNLGGVNVVSVDANRIDAASSIQFKEEFRKLAPSGCARIVLALDGVDFVDSSVLGAIVCMMKLRAPEIRLELSSMGDTVKKVFALTRMDQVFVIHEGIADARAGQAN